MPEAFDRCVRAGGRVRTRSLSNGRHQRFCFLNGKSHSGEVKKTKSKSG